MLRTSGNLFTLTTQGVGVASDSADHADERRIGVALRQIRLARHPGGN